MKVEALAHAVLTVRSLDELRAFKAHLEAHGVAIRGMSDHRVSQSLYIADPQIWRDNPAAVAAVEPLNL